MSVKSGFWVILWATLCVVWRVQDLQHEMGANSSVSRQRLAAGQALVQKTTLKMYFKMILKLVQG